MTAANQSYNRSRAGLLPNDIDGTPPPAAADVASHSGSLSLVIGAGVALVVTLGICVRAVAGLAGGAVLMLVFAWVALPGVIIARRMIGHGPGAWTAALLAGPSWGFAA